MTLAQAVTADTIASVRQVLVGHNGGPPITNDMSIEDMFKAAGYSNPASATTGLQNYNLEAPAKLLFPVLTPFRNRIPRLGIEGGYQANWKAITGINTGAMEIGLSDGGRGGVPNTTIADYFAVFRELGADDFVTFGAQMRAKGFMDLKSTAVTNLLWALMLAEEALDIGGNTSLPLGRGAQPSVSDASTGGALAANTQYSVIVAPLTMAGLSSGSIGNGVRGLVTRTNIDGTTTTYGGGTGQTSVARTITTANDGSAAHSLTAVTAVVSGAAGYAWFWGPSGSEVLGAITTINSVVIASAAAGTQTAASIAGADNSTNGLIYDGIITQTNKTGAGYQAIMPSGVAGVGTPLTADTKGGIVEFDNALRWFWDNLRLSPTTVWVASQEQQNIKQKVLNAGSNGAQRFMINSDQGNLRGGDMVGAYTNPFSMDGAKVLNVRLHPNIPNGTVLFDTETLPYPVSNVPDVLVKRVLQDYQSVDYALTRRRNEFGVSFMGVLQNYFPPAFGVISNIGNG